MFDGNYRPTTTKRQPSSRRRKAADSAATSTRAGILEVSRRQRQERLQREQHIKASVCAQRHVRGFLARVAFIKDLEQALTPSSSGAVITSLDDYVRRLNVRLSPLLLRTITPNDADLYTWLNDDLAPRIRGHQAPLASSASPLAHCIVQTVLRLVRRAVSAHMTVASATCLLKYCLGQPPSQQSAAAAAATNYYWKRIGWSRGYLELLDTLQYYLTTLSSHDGGTSLDPARAAFAQQLWKIVLACTPADQNRAIVCALVLSQPKVFKASSASQRHLLDLRDMGDISVPTLYHQWFRDFVSVITTTSVNRNDPLTRAVQGIYKRSQATILLNAMDLYDKVARDSAPDPSPLIVLLEHSLQQSPQLALLCSLVAKGDNVQQVLAAAASKIDNSAAVKPKVLNEYGSDSDDDDDDYDRTVADGQTLRTGGARTGRLTRNELQTMTKLNRVYSSQVDQWQREILSQVASSKDDDKTRLVELASRIGRPDIWLNWGVTILSQLADSEQGREAYIALLAMLLQTSTGLSPRQSSSSPLLTKLAFHQEFLEKLWRYVLVQVNNSSAPTPVMYMALSVFSDVFSHCLIALKDDQFLSQYTTMLGPRLILAEHVIIQLRESLYDMYWSRPVQVVAIRVSLGTSLLPEDTLESLRGRLFLTGTKLWNSLYERWCRLVRTSPFCSESTWLFSHMVTLTSDNAMAGSSRRRHAGDEAMDTDSDSDNDDEPMSAADEETEELADAFGDPKMARILTCIPQAMPFDKRVRLFDTLLRNDKARTQDESAEMREAIFSFMHGDTGGSARERIAVHRESLYDDAMRQLNRLGPKLRKKVQVTFTNQLGALEAGIDGGGVFKEFIDDLISDAFVGDDRSTAAHHLFSVTPLETLAVNSDLAQDPVLLEHYEFCGRVLGKAIYESILVEPQLCLPFLNQLLGKSNTLEDLKNYDPEVYANLVKLLNATAEQIESMGLTFEINIGSGATMRTVELVRHGSSVAVTKQNAITYVHLVANQRLNIETAQATKAFLRGFRDLIPASWVRLFSAYELQKLISGDDSVKAIDVNSLKASMQYAAGYHPSQPLMQWFWEIIEEFDTDQQRKFLKFMTSCSRQPLLGFASMAPAPCVQQIRLPDEMFINDPERVTPLPTSSTCMNLLKLPNYRNKELLRKKLLAAIESGAGFELT